jgi:hypothetical protein
VSSFNTDFNDDLGASFTPQRMADGLACWDYTL